MTRCDALVVGGGPGGSTTARALHRAGWHVVVCDRARFPRDKVCAGWLTPEVFPLLDLDPAEYRATGLTFQEITGFRTGVLGNDLIETRYPGVVSYAIRRVEFDEFLLRRSGAQVIEGTEVERLERTRDRWVVNGEIETPVIVGAGGHFCPVARHLAGKSGQPRPVVAREAEFPLTGEEAARATEAPELFFCRDLEGYGWCVRKGAYLNVGLGRRERDGFNQHVDDFVAWLEQHGRLTPGRQVKWKGHAYLASGAEARPLTGPGAMLVGDAAGLAYPESGEGIRPAIESGRLAASMLIECGGPPSQHVLDAYAAEIRRRHPSRAATPAALKPAAAALGRALLGSRRFTRRVVLDRWFLRQ